MRTCTKCRADFEPKSRSHLCPKCNCARQRELAHTRKAAFETRVANTVRLGKPQLATRPGLALDDTSKVLNALQGGPLPWKVLKEKTGLCSDELTEAIVEPWSRGEVKMRDRVYWLAIKAA